jgi:RPA family protein
MRSREVAWRLFAEEFNSSTVELEPEGDRLPGHLLSPLGAQINRVFVIGVITDVENISTKEEPLWRARLSDPTGTYFVSAGKYSPEAAGALARIKPPAFCSVIGKTRSYRPEEGVVYLSLKAESVVPSTAALRDLWVLEACKNLRKRIELAEEAVAMESPTPESLVKLGAGRSHAEGLTLALQKYGKPDIDRYRRMLEDCLRYLIPEKNGRSEPGEPLAEAAELDAEGAMDEDASADASEDEKPPYPKEAETKVVKIIEGLQTATRGAAWEKIIEKAKKEGLAKELVDQIVMDLMDSGVLYEPAIGQIRKT